MNATIHACSCVCGHRVLTCRHGVPGLLGWGDGAHGRCEATARDGAASIGRTGRGGSAAGGARRGAADLRCEVVLEDFDNLRGF